MKNKIITSIINIYLDVYRSELEIYGNRYRYVHSLEWTKKRIDFFRKWTLKSIENQSFQDFRVFILCSEKSKELINSYSWDSKIEFCYDYGKQKYEALNTDYISITRLDSDDLIHKDAMKIIYENLILSNKIERLLMSDYWKWLFYHSCFLHIINPLEVENETRWSPCYTLIFPKTEYKNWLNIKKHWFVHNSKICEVKGAKILPPNLVCAILIKESTHCAIWNRDPLDKEQLTQEFNAAKRVGKKVMFSSEEHIGILKDFGIREEQYKNV